MAILGINDFKSKLVGGGARNNLFKVTCNFPAYAQGNTELAAFMIKAAQLPSSIIAPIVIPFRGRQLNIAGDRTFEPWAITVINDTGMEIRNAFERWMNGINAHTTNTGRSNPTDYMADMIVEQLDKAGKVTKKYDIRGCFPSAISPIDVSFDSENTIEEFTVELQVTYWESNTTS
jgi:hypothetical protein